MVKVLLPPQLTEPDAVMVPPDPALEVRVKVPAEAVNEAEMVWAALTLLKVYEVTAPTDDPSTSTELTE